MPRMSPRDRPSPSPSPTAAAEPVDAVLGVGAFARPKPPGEAAHGLLTIGVVAGRSRLSMKAVSLYVRQGLLRADHAHVRGRDPRYRARRPAPARPSAVGRRAGNA